ncbi:MAG: ABC transporter ATP-binding protein [Candidatus Saccharibacteria bacterium]
MTNVIIIKDFKKVFGKLHAVDGINLDVKKGEILGFLGPNGAGKSTTIRCLMGFNKPTEGSISIFGYNMTTDSVKAKQDIGYLPGNVKLYDTWSGWDHIRFFEGVRGKSANINNLIERFDFNPNAKFRHLSSGNKQKLGLILSLMHEPKLLVMDEPTVGLDPLLQNEIYKVLMEMRDKGTTIFISSHNLPEVERLCDRVAIIKEGKLVAVENIKTLGEKKLHKIEVRFGDKFKPSEFMKDGVEKVDEVADGLIITVGGDLNPVLRTLATHKIIDLEITHASLEDVFMKFYERSE